MPVQNRLPQITIEEFKNGIIVSHKQFLISRSLAQKINSSNLVGAQVAPHPQGLVISSMREDSLFKYLGFKKDDVVARINQKKMDPNNAAKLLNEIEKQKEFFVEIIRNNKATSFTILVEK